MLNFNYRHVARWTVIAIALLLTFGLQHSTYSQRDQPLPPTAQGDEHRADPCQEHAPKGKAVGWENHCPPVGAGTGIARGDFDGDGFADLAIGVPFDDPLGVVDAGAVNVTWCTPRGRAAALVHSGINTGIRARRSRASYGVVLSPVTTSGRL